MTRRTTGEILFWNAVLPQTVTSSTDATPIVITKTAHGYSTGDLIMIQGHSTNVAANGIFKIVVLTSSTFALYDYNTNLPVAGSGAGAGSGGVMVIAPKILYCADWRNIILAIDTSGSFNGTIKLAGSLGKPVSNSHGDTPNFGATISASNPYSLMQIIPYDTATPVNGATGITSAGTDLHNTYEVNINALKYFCPLLTAWTAGTITLKGLVSDNL